MFKITSIRSYNSIRKLQNYIKNTAMKKNDVF